MVACLARRVSSPSISAERVGRTLSDILVVVVWWWWWAERKKGTWLVIHVSTDDARVKGERKGGREVRQGSGSAYLELVPHVRVHGHVRHGLEHVELDQPLLVLGVVSCESQKHG